MTLETGEKVLDRQLASAGGGYQPPEGFNWAFAKVAIEGLEKLDQFMVGKKHYSKFLCSRMSVNADMLEWFLLWQ